jgi:hypothetical protein
MCSPDQRKIASWLLAEEWSNMIWSLLVFYLSFELTNDDKLLAYVFVLLERLWYLGFGVRVRVVSSCFTDVCNSIILFLFSCNRQWYNAKNVHLNYE